MLHALNSWSQKLRNSYRNYYSLSGTCTTWLPFLPASEESPGRVLSHHKNFPLRYSSVFILLPLDNGGIWISFDVRAKYGLSMLPVSLLVESTLRNLFSSLHNYCIRIFLHINFDIVYRSRNILFTTCETEGPGGPHLQSTVF